MTRVVAVNSGTAVLPASQLSVLSARSRNVLTTGDCPVYKIFLRRTLGLLRDTLVEGGMSEERFVEALRKVREGIYLAQSGRARRRLGERGGREARMGARVSTILAPQGGPAAYAIHDNLSRLL